MSTENAGADVRDRHVRDAVDKARSLLVDAGVDACVVIATFETEDGLTRTAVKGAGNWHSQSGLLMYANERRKAAAHSEQFFLDEQDREDDDD